MDGFGNSLYTLNNPSNPIATYGIATIKHKVAATNSAFEVNDFHNITTVRTKYIGK